MANSVGRIYNATLGDSQFQSDGEHTLFTTNSSTTQIIKEVTFDPQSGVTFDGGFLEVNGHNVASLTSSGASLTGEYIVPPNSTVKLKLPNTYPVAFYKEYEQFMGSNTTQRLYVNVKVRDQSTGTVTHTISENKNYHDNGIPSSHYSNIIDVVDARSYAATGINSQHNPHYLMSYIYHDSNSVQGQYTIPAKDWNYGGGSTEVQQYGAIPSGNYRGFAYDRDISRSMFEVINFTGVSMGYVPNMLDQTGAYLYTYGSLSYSNSIRNTQTTFNKWNGVASSTPATNQGSFSPSMTSSWPRAHCIGDWYFYIPSSSYSSQIYGISLKTGQFFSFNLSVNWSSSGNYDFTVSIDKDNDKFVFWRPDGSTTMRRAITPGTITEYESITSGGTSSVNCTSTNVSIPNGSINTGTFAACQLSDRMDGGFGYQNNSNVLVMCDIDGNELYSHSQFVGVDTVTPTSNYLWKRTMGKMSASEISAAGISQPTFGIQMFGYTAS